MASVVDPACVGAEEKSAHDLVVLDLRELVNSFDVLVICSARNDRQVRSIVEEVERVVARDVGVHPLRVEGLAEGQWVAMDYGDVIIHVFDEETRSYYDLEHLWNAAAVLRPQTT